MHMPGLGLFQVYARARAILGVPRTMGRPELTFPGIVMS